MRAYLFSPNSQCPVTMLPDLKAVKEKIRSTPRSCRDFVRVTLEDFPNDKAAFIAAWNRHQPEAKRVVKKFRVGGQRGTTLIEISINDD